MSEIKISTIGKPIEISFDLMTNNLDNLVGLYPNIAKNLKEIEFNYRVAKKRKDGKYLLGIYSGLNKKIQIYPNAHLYVDEPFSRLNHTLLHELGHAEQHDKDTKNKNRIRYGLFATCLVGLGYLASNHQLEMEQSALYIAVSIAAVFISTRWIYEPIIEAKAENFALKHLSDSRCRLINPGK